MSSGFQPVNANGNGNGNYTHEPQAMQLDQSPPSQQTVHTSSTEAHGRASRTPLPSGPRLERTAQAAISLPGSDAARPSLQGQASGIIANPNRGRYSAVHVLLLTWEDEEDVAVQQEVEELRSVLETHYHFMVETDLISAQADEPEWACRRLSRRIDQFMGTNDQRDVLKILYYSGRTQLDVNRAMVLTRYVQGLWATSTTHRLLYYPQKPRPLSSKPLSPPNVFPYFAAFSIGVFTVLEREPRLEGLLAKMEDLLDFRDQCQHWCKKCVD